MAKVIVKRKAISPNESVALVRDEKNDHKVWRHRFVNKYRSSMSQENKDYPFGQFLSIKEFETFIEKIPKDKGHIL